MKLSELKNIIMECIDEMLEEGGGSRRRKEGRKDKYSYHSFEMKDTGKDPLLAPVNKETGSRIKPAKGYTEMDVRRTGHRKSSKSSPERVKTWRNVSPRKLPKDKK